MSDDPRCGRLVDHDAHEWSRPSLGLGLPRRDYWCTGRVLTEGGWSKCEGCGTSGPPHPVGGVECGESAREKAISQGDV